MRRICHRAWQRGLLSGFNGNVSVGAGDSCCITRSGAAKGDLQPTDLVLVDVPSGKTLEGSCPSSELGMHLAIYRAMPEVRSVVHTHPRHLLALELRLCALHAAKGNPPHAEAYRDEFLQLPLFEADMQRKRLGFAAALAPGSAALAAAVCEAQRGHEAVWLSRHGLVCRATADTASDALSVALGLSEELEHLAAVQMLLL